MKHLFIINPAAGKGMGKAYSDKILSSAKNIKADIQVCLTTEAGDAERIALKACEDNKKKKGRSKIRIYACGGDGTLNEVINGIFGFKNVQVGCIPIGSGNDFVKNFIDCGDFFSLENQINGEAKKVDLMEYSGIFDNVFSKRVAINMFNLGFDANVANDMNFFKGLHIFHGKGPYRLALASNFIAKRGGNFLVTTKNDEVLYNGKLFFINICNGSYLGGGMKGAPYALIDDGKLDMNIVKNVSRIKFLDLAPRYMKGVHMLKPGIEKVVDYSQIEYVKVRPLNRKFRLGIDGEIVEVTGDVEFRVLPKAISFIVPKREEL